MVLLRFFLNRRHSVLVDPLSAISIVEELLNFDEICTFERKVSIQMNNKKRIQVWLPLLFALTIIIGMWIGFSLSASMGNSGGGLFSRPASLTSLQNILDLVRNRYVDS